MPLEQLILANKALKALSSLYRTLTKYPQRKNLYLADFLRKVGLKPELDGQDFHSVFAHALFAYAYGLSERYQNAYDEQLAQALFGLFAEERHKPLFEAAWRSGDFSAWEQALLTDFAEGLSFALQTLQEKKWTVAELRPEPEAFLQAFRAVVQRTRAPKELEAYNLQLKAQQNLHELQAQGEQHTYLLKALHQKADAQYQLWSTFERVMARWAAPDQKRLEDRNRAIDFYWMYLASLYEQPVLNEEIPLSRLYYAPNFGLHQLFCHGGEGDTFEWEHGYCDLHTAIKQWLLNTETKPENGPCFKWETRESNLWILLGYPGQGKTSFCKRLLYDLCTEADLQQQYRHVWFARLRSIANVAALVQDPEATLRTQLLKEVQRQAPDVDFPQLPANAFDHAVLVLDGLDELQVSNKLDTTAAEDFIQKLARLCADYTGLRVVLTSRYGYFEAHKLENTRLRMVALAENELFAQQTWLSVYRFYRPETRLTLPDLAAYDAAYQAESNKHPLGELVRQPILLHLVARLEELPAYNANRAAIYDLLFDQLVQRTWDESGQIAELAEVTPEDLRQALRKVAFRMFKNGKGFLGKAEVESDDLLRRIFTQAQVKRLMIASYFTERKEEKELDAIKFLHKSLQEFLCAEHLYFTFQEAFEEQTTKNRYVLDAPKEVLKLIQELFSARALTHELQKDLRDLIQNRPIEERQHLSERLKKFLPEILRNQGLYRWERTDDGLGPLDMAHNAVEGFCFLLMVLLDKEDYSTEEVRSLLSYLLRLAPGVISNLAGQSLHHTNLQGAYLVRANLVQANLVQANLVRADLERADLERANLEGANLEGANLVQANLVRANLVRANLVRANLQGANLQGANLQGAFFQGANFQGANLLEANLLEANLQRAYLQGAYLQGAYLVRAYLQGAYLQGAYLQGAYLQGATVETATLAQAHTLHLATLDPDLKQALLDAGHGHLFEDPEDAPNS